LKALLERSKALDPTRRIGGGHGVPLSLVVTGANRHDVSPLECSSFLPIDRLHKSSYPPGRQMLSGLPPSSGDSVEACFTLIFMQK
jgi:hypothetical protein